MTDPALIADLVRAGVDADLVGRVANAIASATVRGQSADTADTRRERDRLRKQKSRTKSTISTPATEANDAAAHPNLSADSHADNADKRCQLSSFLTSKSGFQESKKEVVARARGTRLSADMELPDEWRAFAVHCLVDADAAFAEFKDYWIAIPGQRGTKLNWFATWRNRVRNLPKRGNRNGQTARDHSKDKFRSALEQVREYGARGDDGGEVVRLLPATGRG